MRYCCDINLYNCCQYGLRAGHFCCNRYGVLKICCELDGCLYFLSSASLCTCSLARVHLSLSENATPQLTKRSELFHPNSICYSPIAPLLCKSWAGLVFILTISFFPPTTTMPRVFLITGTSTGFGKHLVQEVIDRGDIAVATARNPSTLSFENTKPENYLALKLDVTVPENIDSAFSAALKRFGRIDVVVNNAGYSLSGAFEELSDAQIKKQMDVNFFGLLAITRKAMKVMREQKPCGGVIQQVTSIGGQIG